MTTKAEIRAEVRRLADEHDIGIPFGILRAIGEPAERERQFQQGVDEFRSHLPDGVEFPVTGRNEDQESDQPTDGGGLTRSEVFNALDDEALAAQLVEAGFASVSSIVEAEDEELLALPGVGPATLRHLNEVFGREPTEPEGQDADEEADGD